MITFTQEYLQSLEDQSPRMKLKRVIRNNLHWAWIVPFSIVENLPTLLSGMFDVLVDTVTLGRHYLMAVRQSVESMNDFHAIYREDSDDGEYDTENENEGSVSGESQVSTGSRMSTRSSSKKKN
jgi:hypothetical protein